MRLFIRCTGPDATPVDALPIYIFDKALHENFRSVFLVTNAAVPYLRASTNDPNILTAASTGAYVGYPAAAAYGSTKAAIVPLTRVAAIDLAPVIRVNACSPGTVDTRLVPRIGQPGDVANLLAWLASSQAS